MAMNKKGFIFTLDIILGIIIVFTIISVSVFFVSQNEPGQLTKHQLSQVGSDIIVVMEERGNFDNPNAQTISLSLNELIPPNYDMLVRVEGNFDQGNDTLDVGGNIPLKESIISGQRISLTEDNTYLKITYFVWSRTE